MSIIETVETKPHNMAPQIAMPQIARIDLIWEHIRNDAMTAIGQDQDLDIFLQNAILDQPDLETALLARLAMRLHCADMPLDRLLANLTRTAEKTADWPVILRTDIRAVHDLDPACHRFMDPILYFKGFHAIQTHRLAHALWQQGRRDFAYYLQSRSSAIFQTDIHPAAQFGAGIFLDHATGLVVGETAVIEDNVSILHAVTLGGTGKAGGDRHPKIRRGVLIGAGAKILGNIEIGACSKIASGSVVLKNVPARVTVAGVPAKIIGRTDCLEEPARAMDQTLDQALHDDGSGI